jgi:hypothetical protein
LKLQLINKRVYTDENKKDFDIVAAAGMAELADEEISFKKLLVSLINHIFI